MQPSDSHNDIQIFPGWFMQSAASLEDEALKLFRIHGKNEEVRSKYVEAATQYKLEGDYVKAAKMYESAAVSYIEDRAEYELSADANIIAARATEQLSQQTGS